MIHRINTIFKINVKYINIIIILLYNYNNLLSLFMILKNLLVQVHCMVSSNYAGVTYDTNSK